MSDTHGPAQLVAALAEARQRVSDLETENADLAAARDAAISAKDGLQALLDAASKDHAAVIDQHVSEQTAALRRDLAAALKDRDAARSQAEADVAAAHSDRDAALADTDKAKSDRTAFAAKFDLLHGEVEAGSGISRCAGYLTDDGTHFETLDQAHRHQFAALATKHGEAARTGQPIRRADVLELTVAGRKAADPKPAGTAT